jgi:hypothetical protein
MAVLIILGLVTLELACAAVGAIVAGGSDAACTAALVTLVCTFAVGCLTTGLQKAALK